jgi:hypothetical protein
MYDWFLLLTPVLIAVLLMPVVFLGCTPFAEGPPRWPPDLTFAFGYANNPENEPNPATPTQICYVAVYWTLYGRFTEGSRKFLPPQQKGTPGVAFPPHVSDNTLDVTFTDIDPASVVGVACKCDVGLPDLSIRTTNEAYMDYTNGQYHVFVLVREPAAPNAPFFSVRPDTVKN